MQFNISLLAGLFLFAILSCKNENKPVLPETQGVEIPHSFLEFYKKFHADTLFQLERVVFPLAEKSDSTKWQREDWKAHKGINNSKGEYTIEFDNFSDIIIEVIQDKQQIFRSERRFSQMEGKWYLIYYRVKSVNLE